MLAAFVSLWDRIEALQKDGDFTSKGISSFYKHSFTTHYIVMVTYQKRMFQHASMNDV
jgi:hypothetical protein